MKYADCNARQKKAYRNIYHACNWFLGGLENTMLDNPEGSEEYESAKATLANHDGLVAELYRMATTDLYDDGSCCFNQAAERYLKDIRFCGKEWLMARCEARIRKPGIKRQTEKPPQVPHTSLRIFLCCVIYIIYNIEKISSGKIIARVL